MRKPILKIEQKRTRTSKREPLYLATQKASTLKLKLVFDNFKLVYQLEAKEKKKIEKK